MSPLWHDSEPLLLLRDLRHCHLDLVSHEPLVLDAVIQHAEFHRREQQTSELPGTIGLDASDDAIDRLTKEKRWSRVSRQSGLGQRYR